MARTLWLRQHVASAAAVILDARRAKPGQPVLLDRPLPTEELVHGQLVAITSLVEAQEAAAHGCDDFGFSPNYPPLGVFRRQVRHRQRTSVRTDDVTYAGSELLIGHLTLHTFAD